MDFSSTRLDDLLSSMLSKIGAVSRRRFLLSSTAAGAEGAYLGMNQALAREPNSGGNQFRNYRSGSRLYAPGDTIDASGGCRR